MAKSDPINLNTIAEAQGAYKQIQVALKQLNSDLISISTVVSGLNGPAGLGLQERTWCMDGPYDCQWQMWPTHSDIFINDPSKPWIKGTYRFVAYLEDDDGKYRVYRWAGWDAQPPPPFPMKLKSVAIGNGYAGSSAISIMYDEI